MKTFDFKGAIFDLDGTLLDSLDVWDMVDDEFLSKRGLAVPYDYTDAICAKSFREAAKYTRELFCLGESEEEIMAEWNSSAKDHYANSVKLLPNACEYLAHLKSRGVKLGVATSLSHEMFEPCLVANGIFDVFDALCSVDDIGCGKESPDVFFYAMEKLGLSPRECVIFEDTLPSIKSAKLTGATVIGVREKHSEKSEEEIRAVADDYIDDLSHAPLPR